MAKQILTPLVLVPQTANTSGLQLSKLISGGSTTISSPIGVDNLGNVVLAGYSSPSTVTVEFTIPLSSYSFLVNIGGAQAGMNVICCISGTYQSGAFVDEFEMEPMLVAGTVWSTNVVMFTLATVDMTLLTLGRKTIIYQLG